MPPRWTRRQVVQNAGAVSLGLLAGCGRLPWQAPQPAPLPRIGLLAAARDTTATVRQALEEVGYVHGRNMLLEVRTAEGRLDALPALASELVQLPVDVIVTTGTPATLAAKDATSTIPIVQAVGAADLVREGVVVSLAGPGGNVTGLTEIVPELTAKRLQLLSEVVPGLSRVAVLGQVNSPNAQHQMDELQRAAPVLGVQLQSLLVNSPNELASVLDAALREQAEALMLVTDPLTVIHQAQIASLAIVRRLPSIFDRRDYVTAGGLMSYGPDTVRLFQRAAVYVDRILQGTKPADLPIERPTTFLLVVNARTAQALGLTIPPHVLLQATEIIE